MSIKFDSLPKQNPGGGAVKPGLYYAHIEKTEMKQSKDKTKPPYLNLTLKLTDRDGKKAGTLFDMMSESDSAVIQYKIGRFIRACGIPLVGEMELKDIGKIVAGKDIVVDVKNDEYNGKKRAVVNLFDNEAYYLPSEYEEVYAAINGNAEDKAEANADFAASMPAEGENGTLDFDDSNSGSPAPAESAEEY